MKIKKPLAEFVLFGSVSSKGGVVNVVLEDGEVVIETYTVMYGANGPEIGHAACLTADGKRTFANTSDADVMQAMTTEEFCGRRASIDGKGNLTVL